MSAAVQKELGLTEKQKSQLKKLDSTMMQRRRRDFSRGADGDFDPRAMRSAMEASRREYDAAVAKILDKKQKDRLTQIELQREGLLAVARPDVAAKLKLTAAQSKEVETIADQMRQSLFRSMPRPPGGPPPGEGPGQGQERPSSEGPLPGGGPPPGGEFPGGGPPPGGPPEFNREEFRAQFAKMRETQEKIRTTAIQEIGEVLTQEQKDAFDKLLGKPFDFARLRPPSGPGSPPEGTPSKDGSRTQAKSKSRRARTR
jgi:hypothetical protein